MSKFIKTIQVSTFSDIPAAAKPGQWFQQRDGVRGQYLGTTKAGTQVMHYNTTKHPQIIRNACTAQLRGFALTFAR